MSLKKMNLKQVRKKFCNPLKWMDQAEEDLIKWSKENDG